jgi:hydrogenase maturation factor
MLTLRADGTIALDDDDAESLHLVDQKRSGTGGAAATDEDETLIYDNITLGQARIMTGNVGVENWRIIARRKVTITNNKFGQDVRIMTGDQGGDAAKSFNDNFWN